MSMKRQERLWSCGAACIRNAIRALGRKLPEHTIRALAGTTERYGTCHLGILGGLSRLGFHGEEYRSNDLYEAWEWLHATLCEGYPVIMCVENWEHWVTAIGTLGDSGVTVFDPSNFKKNIYENRVHVWGEKMLRKKWINTRVSLGDEDRIYAIAVYEE